MKINCKHCGYSTTSNGKIYIKKGYRLRFACKSCLKVTLTDDNGVILNARQPHHSIKVVEYMDLLTVINKWVRNGLKKSF